MIWLFWPYSSHGLQSRKWIKEFSNQYIAFVHHLRWAQTGGSGWHTFVIIEEFRNAFGHSTSIMTDTDLIGIDHSNKLDSDYPYRTWLDLTMIWRNQRIFHELCLSRCVCSQSFLQKYYKLSYELLQQFCLYYQQKTIMAAQTALEQCLDICGFTTQNDCNKIVIN